ncbi:hypothetical protein GO986_09065 [Deinococcus sp. HMF7620]|uniref:Uncharacterized protein n=1 Tax=Deinococcus arboris TaxID=2682977 RepID=A0A7C9HRE4_9DEIO|nr:hypothetical protein [Deinococcus arboris]MVN86914.1 hypothetical protein [Deinococcus arboris]
MEYRIAGLAGARADFGKVGAGQTGTTINATLVNTDSVARTIKLRVRQLNDDAGTGAASVTLNGVAVPLTTAWLPCGVLEPGESLALTTSWYTAAGQPADKYLAEDLAFVEADII